MCAWSLFLCFTSLVFISSKFVHWRRPKGTLSSRQTTLLKAACTQTAKAAPCLPSTAGPTPPLNQSRTSRPAERSCAWSPSKLRCSCPWRSDGLSVPTSFSCPFSLLPFYTSLRPKVETVWLVLLVFVQNASTFLYALGIPSLFLWPSNDFYYPQSEAAQQSLKDMIPFVKLHCMSL